MKLKLFIALIISIAFLNISCADHKYENDKQPAPDTSEQPAEAKKPAEAKVQPEQTAQTSKPAPEKSRYQYPDDNGIGPIKNVTLGKLDPKLVAKGKTIFNTKCVACHKLDSRLVGPPLRNITKKNTPEFIMNYLLNTSEMQKKDPILEKLVAEYKVIMPDQQLSKNDARSVLEYFRSVEK